MIPWLGELIGTAMLVFLGTSVVANAVLDDTNGNGGGPIFITIGWAMAVMIPAIIFAEISGSHFNPALTIAFAVAGNFPWEDVPLFVIGQLAGGMLGAAATWAFYYDHLNKTKGSRLGVFATGARIRNTPVNCFSEFLATFILAFALLGLNNQPFADGTNLFGVGGVILVIGIALGGTTGYALNPARDLGPRIIHHLLPIKDKTDSDWGYAWIPVIMTTLGAIVGALLATAIF
ncbi:MAG: aquaporin family protein [Defluviitaleaceae bacterium]|nr:aquaporin family protein [Defluviitaleaceae bacterium]